MRTLFSRSILILLTSLALLGTAGETRTLRAQASDPLFGFTGAFGNGPGYNESFWTAEAFIPIVATNRDMTFFNWRPIMSWDGLIGNNVGGGYRMYAPNIDRMFGFYGYYDMRDTVGPIYHQASAGFETVGNNWAGRTNVYVPIKPGETTMGVTAPTAPFFIGNNIADSTTSIFQSALMGADAEFGMPLPVNFGLWAFGGVYGYNPVNDKIAIGVKARLEARLTDNLLANVSVQDDRLFGLTANLQLAWYWRGWRPRLGYGGCDVTGSTGYSRLAQPVQRNYNIVVHNRTTTINRVLTDPFDGNAIRVIHVDNASTGDNTGTFENPAQSLTLARQVSLPGDIIYVHNTGQLAAGVAAPNLAGMNSGITLQARQRLLAGGFQHFVTTNELGPIALPQNFTGAAFLGQTITNTAFLSNVVTLADNTEVSGFRIINSRNNGISSSNQVVGNPIVNAAGVLTNARGISINRNVIVDFAGAFPNNQGVGIYMANAFGTVNIGVADARDGTGGFAGGPWGNSIGFDSLPGVAGAGFTGLAGGHPDGGIAFIKTNATPTGVGNPNLTTLNIANNTIRNNGDGNVPTDSTTSPFYTQINPVPAIITNDLSLSRTDSGITIIADGGTGPGATQRPTITTNITSNIIRNNGGVVAGVPHGDGVHIVSGGFGSITANFTTNTIGTSTATGNANDGVYLGADSLTPTDLPLLTANMFGNVITGNGTLPTATNFTNGGSGVEAVARAAGQITLNMGGSAATANTVSLNRFNGVRVRAEDVGGALVTANLFDNIITGNGSPPGVGVIPAVGSGVRAESAGTAAPGTTVNLDMRRNTVTGNVLNGVFGNGSNQNSTLTMSITDANNISNNGLAAATVGLPNTLILNGESIGNGIGASISGASVFNLTVSNGAGAGNTINGNLNNGIAIFNASTTRSTVNIDSNASISGNGNVINTSSSVTHNGVFLQYTGAITVGQHLATVNNNTSISSNGRVTQPGVSQIGDGVHTEITNGIVDLTISGNTIGGAAPFVNGIGVGNGNAGDGIGIYANTAGLGLITISNNVLNNNGSITPSTFTPGLGNSMGNGIYLEANGGSASLEASSGTPLVAGVAASTTRGIQNNTITNSGANGIYSRMTAAGNVLNLSIEQNTITGSGRGVTTPVAQVNAGRTNANGIRIDTAGGGTGFRGVIQNNNAATVPPTGVTNNADHGILVNLGSNGRNGGSPLFPADLLITQNTANLNGLNGIQVNNGGVNNNIQVTNNVTTANSNHYSGIVVNNLNTGTVLQVNNNVVRGNGVPSATVNAVNPVSAVDGHGIVVNNYSTFASAQINTNTISGNLHNGLSLNSGSDQFGLSPAGAFTNTQIVGNIIGGATPFAAPTTTPGVGNGWNGIFINANTGNNITLTGNQTNGNGFGADAVAPIGNGVFVNLTGNGNTINLNQTSALSPAQANNNFRDGIFVQGNATTGNNISVTNYSAVNANGLNGIEVVLNGATNTVLIDNNTASGNGTAATGGNGIAYTSTAGNLNTTISNNTVTNSVIGTDPNSGNGIFANMSGATSSLNIVTNNVGTVGNGNQRDGIRVNTAFAGNGSIINVNTNTVLANNGNGVNIAQTGGGTNTTFNLNSNTIGGDGTAATDNRGNGASGVLINLAGNSLAFIGTTGANQINNNHRIAGGTAAGIQYLSTGNSNSLVVEQNTVQRTLNGSSGILATVNAPATNNTVFIRNNNNAINNTLDGIQVAYAGSNSNAQIQVNGNTATGNTRDGIRIENSGANNIGGQVNNNTVTGNGIAAGGNGINYISSGNGNVTTISTNTATGNQDNGIRYQTTNTVTAGNGVTITANTATNNVAGNGILAQIDGSNSSGAPGVDINANQNLSSNTNGAGIQVNVNGDSNAIRVQNNVQTISNNRDGVAIAFAATADNNLYTVNGNTTITGNLRNGMLFTLNGTNNDGNINDNIVNGNATAQAGAGIAFAVTGTNHDTSMLRNTVSNNGAVGLATNGILITTTGTASNFTILGNTVSGNTGNAANGDGIQYIANGAATGNLIIGSNPIPTLGVPAVTNASNITGNTNDGVDITLNGTSTIRAQVVRNVFGGLNGTAAFRATTNAGTNLGLQFFANSAVAGGAVDYVFVQNSAGTFAFENNNFDEVGPFVNGAEYPLYRTTTNGTTIASDFSFTGTADFLTGTEDRAVGTFFADPGPPY
ncbi:MAG: beta strand repeat-containing protein [Pirellulales bacterium]